MKKLLAITAILILGCITASGQNKLHLKYGVEWGYDASFLDKYHSIYFDPEVGYRIDAEGTKLYLYSNGYVNARVGVELFKHYSATLLAGYCGVKQDRRIFTYTFRASYFIDSYDVSGYFAFLEGGGGYHYSSDPEIKSEYDIKVGKIGGGYRLKMSKKSSLDFMASVQLTKDHPGIYNPEIPGYIPDFYVRVSDDLFASFNLSCAISF
ncbi:MAG: hypothetical protein Q4G10_03220 [Bacteroidia bacterium]|nr:hypothetical protein [Bacteroidia bacterium]